LLIATPLTAPPPLERVDLNKFEILLSLPVPAFSVSVSRRPSQISWLLCISAAAFDTGNASGRGWRNGGCGLWAGCGGGVALTWGGILCGALCGGTRELCKLAERVCTC